MAKLDALRLAGAKEPDRLQIHQRYLGHLQYDRATAAPYLGPEFDEIFRAEPADQLDAGTVLFRHRLDFECHTESVEQRMGQSKLLRQCRQREGGLPRFRHLPNYRPKNGRGAEYSGHFFRRRLG